MRIITWNCNGALRKKFSRLTELDADIYIIQECENPDLTKDNEYRFWASNYLWIGDSKNKGVGIFAKAHVELEQLDWSSHYKDHRVKYFLPCKVNGSFNLLAVWTHRNNSPNFGYIGQFWKYQKVNKEHFGEIIIAGDFNSNSFWDQWDRWWNHTDVVNELKEQQIYSAYHYLRKEEQGKELIPTFYLQRNLEKSYHIDYVFCSESIMKRVDKLQIGDVDEWIEISDHVPIVLEMKY